MADSYYAASVMINWKDIVIGDPKMFIVPIVMSGLSAPANNSSTINNSPTFSWSAAQSYNGVISKYQLFIDGTLDQDNLSDTSTTPSAQLAVGSHTWYVVAFDDQGNTSQSAIYNLTILYSPTTPSLSAPANNFSTISQTPTFSWSSVQSYNGAATYQLFIDDTLNQDNLTDTSTNPSAPLSVGNHTWYVVAIDDQGHTSQSQTRNLTITYSPSTVTLLAPANNSSTIIDSPTFSWSAAQSYNGVISKYQLFIDGTLDQDNLSDTSTTPSAQLAVGSHTWYVVAFDDQGNTSQSSSYTLNIMVNGVCGSANGQEFFTAPSDNLCLLGTAWAVFGSGPWVWTCAGINGGSNALCSAELSNDSAVDGSCGSSNGKTFSVAPSSNLCSSGNTSSVLGSGPWVWTCSGINGGIDSSCSASPTTSGGGGGGGGGGGASYTITNGSCGSSNGKTFSVAPSSNLCSSGNTSSVSGTGPWTWTCFGINGGTNTSCSAASYQTQDLSNATLFDSETQQLIEKIKQQIEILTNQLNELLKNGSPGSTANFTFTSNLCSGDFSPDVAALQHFLNTHGFVVAQSGPGSLGKETNFFGAATSRAIMLYQKSIGLIPYPCLGPKTRESINKELNK